MRDRLEQGRASYEADAWADACVHLEAADVASGLDLVDLERLAAATYLVGKEIDSTRVWTRAFHAAMDDEEPARAARNAFWIAFVLLNRGDLPGGSGWIARGQRAVRDRTDVVEHGYLRYLEGLPAIFGGDAATARQAFEEAADAAERVGDIDLAVLAGIGLGRSLVRLGHLADGVACLDEAMVAMTDGVSPIIIGDGYCSAIDASRELVDLPRARYWTQGLSDWCERHDDLIAFRGQCLIHRAEVLQMRGSWQDALTDAESACRRLARPAGQLAIGAANYQQGELHRLRGEFDQAATQFEEARRRGRDPQPGLALLRLTQGRLDDAAASIRRKLTETNNRWSRSRLLPAAVEILVAAGDLDTADKASAELASTAEQLDSRMLEAQAFQARGAVELARDQPELALPSLRRALELWQDLEVPHDAARVRMLVGDACRRLSDLDAAHLEWQASRATFRELGAACDLAALDRVVERGPAADGLTRRELEVLRGVAAGRTNRQIAADLVISHRTVDRHVSNILTKLGVASRTAAAGHAHKHDLL